MILLAGFLEVMLRAILFVGMAMAIGGVVFRWVVIPALGESETSATTLQRVAGLAAWGAGMMASCQALSLLITPWSLADDNGVWPLAAFFSTRFAQISLLRVGLELIFLAVLIFLRLRRGGGRVGWIAASALALVLMIVGGWLTHGASRLHDTTALMTITVLHQLAAAVWIGGVIHLTVVWRILREAGRTDDLWPASLSRFSKAALASVALLLVAGAALYWPYVHGWQPLLGTAYGTMLLTKMILTAALLALGALNLRAIRQWRATRGIAALLRQAPVLVETEAAIGIVILMAAAAITGQPPAADVANQSATPAETAWVFAPKWPQLTPAPWKEMLATRASLVSVYAIPSHFDGVQSNFNHNISGIFVILIGLAALLHRIGLPWLRNWPLIFLPFGLFILLFAEATVWPLGPDGFWSTLISPAVATHRFAALLVAALGLFQWWMQTSDRAANSRWRFAFPLLLFVGGAMLLSHSHTVFAVKWAFLIEVSHNAIGILAVLAGAASWLELRLGGREGRIAGIVWPVCLTLVGVVLLFYRETVFV